MHGVEDASNVQYDSISNCHPERSEGSWSGRSATCKA